MLASRSGPPDARTPSPLPCPIMFQNLLAGLAGAASGVLAGAIGYVPLFGMAGALDPRYCILTDTTGYDPSNLSVDPQFVAEYMNGPRGPTAIPPDATTALATPAAFLGGTGDVAQSADGVICATYCHGLFDAPEALAALLQWAGADIADTHFDAATRREADIDRLADAVDQAFRWEKMEGLLP